MPKNKSNESHDREYIIPAPIDEVMASIRALDSNGDAWQVNVQSGKEDSYRFTALQENPHLPQHLVGVRGRILRYENNNTRVQLDTHSDKTRLLEFIWWLRLFTPILAIFPVLLLSQYTFFGSWQLSFLIVLGFSPALYAVYTMMREGVREREMLDNTIAKAKIVMDYLQEQHVDEFGDITPIFKDRPMRDTSRLEDDAPQESETQAPPQVQVRNNRR